MTPNKEITAETLTDEEVEIVLALRNKCVKNLLLWEKSMCLHIPDINHQITSEEILR